MMERMLLLLPVLLGIICDAAAVADVLAQTHVGRRFVFAYGENYQPNSDPTVIITNMSPLEQAVVDVNISTPIHGILHSLKLRGFQSVTQVTVPRELVPSVPERNPVAIIVESDDDITVHAINDAHDRSMDGLTVLPVHSLGTEYVVVSYTPSLQSQIVIVAVEDNTEIKLLLSNEVTYRSAIVPAGRTILIEAQQLNAFFLYGPSDLTGTKITSDKPVVVITGNRCAFVPTDIVSCDHLTEMLTPYSQWGRVIVVMPFLGRSTGAIFRVIAGRGQTNITVESKTTTLYSAGDYLEFEVGVGSTSLVTADKPVMVMQYAKGYKADNQPGDPSMTIVPPMEQSIHSVKLPTYNKTKENKIMDNYVNVYALCTELYNSSLMLDGELLRDIVTEDRIMRVEMSSYCAVGLRLDHGLHRIEPKPPSLDSFVAIAYGFAEMNSYAWPAGFATRKITCEYTSPVGELNYYSCDKQLFIVEVPCPTVGPTEQLCINIDCIKTENVIYICAGVAVGAIILQNLFSHFVIKRTSIVKEPTQIAFGQVGLDKPSYTHSHPEIAIHELSDWDNISQRDGVDQTPSQQRKPYQEERADRLRKTSGGSAYDKE